MSSRDFVAASSQVLIYAGVIVVPPCTLSCWFYTDATETGGKTLMGVGDSSSGGYFRLLAQGNSGGSALKLRALIRDSTPTSSSVDSTTTYSEGAWHHAAMVLAADGTPTVYLDGGNSASGLSGTDPNGEGDLTTSVIGKTERDGSGLFMDGQISQCGWYNAVLSAADIAQLAAGFVPPMVRPDALVAWHPLLDDDSDRDWWGGYDMVDTNSPAYSDNSPPTINASSPKIVVPRVTAVSGEGTAGNMMLSLIG